MKQNFWQSHKAGVEEGGRKMLENRTLPGEGALVNTLASNWMTEGVHFMSDW